MSIDNIPSEVLTRIWLYSGNFNIPQVCKCWKKKLINDRNQIPSLIFQELQEFYCNSPHVELMNRIFPLPNIGTIQQIVKQFIDKVQHPTLKHKIQKIFKKVEGSFAQKIYKAQRELILYHEFVFYMHVINSLEHNEMFLLKIQIDPIEVKIQKIFKELQNNFSNQIITEWDLSENFLMYIPLQIENLTTLKVLELDKNNISFLPQEMEKLICLETLILEKNELRDISVIVKLTALKVLNLAENLFSQFPSPNCFPISLRDLDLSQNQIQSIPSSVEQLTFLSDLNLMQNALTTLPPEIAQVNASYENNPFLFLPSHVYLPEATENYDTYTQYVFDLSKDIKLLEQQMILPSRLIHMIKLWIKMHPDEEKKMATQSYLKYLYTLKDLNDQLSECIENEKIQEIIKLFLKIMQYKSENELFNQQIAEVIKEALYAFPDNSIFIKALDSECMKILNLPQKDQNYEGIWRLSARPLDTKFIDMFKKFPIA